MEVCESVLVSQLLDKLCIPGRRPSSGGRRLRINWRQEIVNAVHVEFTSAAARPGGHDSPTFGQRPGDRVATGTARRVTPTRRSATVAGSAVG
jgi:hypothetical protein